MAIGEGADAIRLGRADVMLCGGTEAPITHVGIAGFGSMRALSRRNDDPQAASRPFDPERDGFVMGEAGGVVVLEELERAKSAARRSTPSCSATASPRTRTTSPSLIRPASRPPAR